MGMNETANNITEYPSNASLINEPIFQIIFYMIYAIIFVLGISGNVLVCYVVMRNRTMQTVTNIFITNLALSDILMCIIAVPFTPLYSFIGEWIFGTVLCHLITFSQSISVYISTLTLMSIAVDRFVVIMYPFKERMRLQTAVIIICIIWIFSIVATLPYGVFMNLVEISGKRYCEERWPSEMSRHVFSVCTSILQFVVPFVVITYCYIRISIRLSVQAKLKPGAKSSRKDEAEWERKCSINRMLIAMVAIFAISWFPININNLIQDTNINVANWQYATFCFFIAHAIAMSSTCYNPFVYAWLNKNFRKEFEQVLPCFSVYYKPYRSQFSRYELETSCNGNDTTADTLMPETAL